MVSPFSPLARGAIAALRAQSNGIRIFYQTYGHGSTKVLLIIGFAGTLECWSPQIKGLTGRNLPNDCEPKAADDEGHDGNGIEVCCFDNRGMGRSSVPTNKSDYTTILMAQDALALVDHLGWKKAHVFGHSLGSMIAFKMAAVAPNRVSTLALLNTSGGGFECFPKIELRSALLALRFLRARTPEQRALVDLEVHYTKEYLDQDVGSSTRKKIIYEEYVNAISSSGMQSTHGRQGQINACWTNMVTTKELDTIRSSGILVSIIHGRNDVIAQLYYARRLAEKLYPAAKIIEFHGAHLVSHERSDEVNMCLMELIKASKRELTQEEWSNLPGNETELSSLTRRSYEGVNFLVVGYDMLGKLQYFMLFFFGILIMIFDRAKRVLQVVKPIQVAPAIPENAA